MRETTRKALSGLMVLAAAGGITAGIADAAKSKKDNNRSKKAAKKSHKADRHARGDRGHWRPAPPPELTGDDANKAKAAALEAVPGGTVWRASKEDPAEGTDAAYEVHVRKADGSEVEVLLDKDFKVIKTVAWDGPPHGGPDGHHGPPPGGPPPGAPGPGAGYGPPSGAPTNDA